MIRNQIYKVLSIFKKHRVKALLIGGQATILYGASEFSRDIDFAVLLDNKNLEKIKLALTELRAEQIYFPSLTLDYLAHGHACHFRCGLPEVRGFRIDIIAVMRGCSNFLALWRRRKIIKGIKGLGVNVISLKDLVQSKKTQRDKDWYMIKRLVSADILYHKKVSNQQIEWWFKECRTPNILIDLAKKYPGIFKKVSKERILLKWVRDAGKLNKALIEEENIEREKDRIYWLPLRKELEQMRHSAAKPQPNRKQNTNR